MMMPEKDKIKLMIHTGPFIRKLGGWGQYKKWLILFTKIERFLKHAKR